jgi:predicted O-methyltransferase YrrM
MTRPPAILDRIIDRNLLPIFACEQGYKVGVEIGTFKGEYAFHCLQNWPGLLYTVDPFENQPDSVYRDGCNQVPMEEVATEAMTRLDPWIKDGRCHLLIMDSVEASKRFTGESLDFVFLDGNHREEVVAQEIALYWPLIKSGAAGGTRCVQSPGRTSGLRGR